MFLPPRDGASALLGMYFVFLGMLSFGAELFNYFFMAFTTAIPTGSLLGFLVEIGVGLLLTFRMRRAKKNKQPFTLKRSALIFAIVVFFLTCLVHCLIIFSLWHMDHFYSDAYLSLFLVPIGTAISFGLYVGSNLYRYQKKRV